MIGRVQWVWLAAVLLAVNCDAGEPPKSPAMREYERQQHERDMLEVREQAVHDAEQAKAKLDAVMRELDQLDAALAEAVKAVADAKNDAERAAATTSLRRVQRQKAEAKNRAAAARAAATVASGVAGVPISSGRSENPLAYDGI